MTGKLSLGLMGALDHGVLRELGPGIEAAGFHALWLNDGAGAGSLEAFGAVAGITSTLVLGTGVVPFHRRPADEIAGTIARLGLPEDRLVLGVGSGTGDPKPVSLVRSGIAALRPLTSAPIVVGALGPRMRELGATEADGVLLSWLTPSIAAEQADEARRQAADASRPAPRVVLYARTAVDPAAQSALEKEAAAYGGYPSYAANFARLGIDPIATTIGPDDLAARIPEYLDVVDELVLRAITPDNTADQLAAFIADPRLGELLATQR
jgi:alkanesulfonate monooxygenase SsuD/methylene tetrahydromethanopterin reductase-like flavin-dependent oxidoreductase (luciferase family)